MPVSLLVLALSSFSIGTTEFVIMGLLPEVAADLKVSIPEGGWLITAYALGVAIGAPFMTLLTSRLPRRKALIVLMAVFVLGNLCCALAQNYTQAMLARIVTSLCHGAFFGIGAVFASDIVPPDRRASAVALMFSGLTLANVLGVPLGTTLGQAMGWRSTFWVITALGIVTLVGLHRYLPRQSASAEAGSTRAEFSALASLGLWRALLTTAMFSAAMFALFTYIAPLLGEVTGLSPRGISLSLVVIGVGLTIGNYLGGKCADRHLVATLCGAFAAMALTSAVFSVTSQSLVAAELTLLVWAMASFALVPALQINVVNCGTAAPSLISTMNIGAFNVGNAIGAWVGGVVIDSGAGLQRVPLAAAVLAVLGLFLALIRHKPARR